MRAFTVLSRYLEFNGGSNSAWIMLCYRGERQDLNAWIGR